MNYIELINAFWEHDEALQFSCTETRLYFYLVKVTNRLGWPKQWSRSDERVCTDIGVSLRSMKAARKRLEDVGLISVTIGGKGRGYKTNYEINPPKRFFCGTKNIPEVQPKGMLKVQPKVQPNSLYIGTRDKQKQKLKHNNSHELLSSCECADKDINRPNLNEVKDYFNGRMQQWQQNAELFYYYFDGIGWKTASGRPIINWKSKADYWITEKKINNKEYKKTIIW